MDTIFRSSLGDAASPSGAPHPWQNLAVAMLSVPQAGQITS
jgi:hypothetical protein